MHALTLEKGIVLTDKPDERIGPLRIQFSRDKLDATIRSNFYQLILQILAVDLVLIVLLLTSLRIVFRPLADLREALMMLVDRTERPPAASPSCRRASIRSLPA